MRCSPSLALVRDRGKESNPEIHLFSDGAVSDLSEFENKALPLIYHRVGKSANNLGITTLDVRANPYAHVYAGNKDLGITPLKPLPQLPACTIRVKLVYEKTTRTETVHVVANKTTSLRVEME